MAFFLGTAKQRAAKRSAARASGIRRGTIRPTRGDVGAGATAEVRAAAAAVTASTAQKSAKQSALNQINALITRASGAERTRLLSERDNISNIAARDFDSATTSRVQATVSREQTKAAIVAKESEKRIAELKAKELTQKEFVTRRTIERLKAGTTLTQFRTFEEQEEERAREKQRRARELAAKIEERKRPITRAEQQDILQPTFTPGGEIRAAPAALRARTFFTPEKQIQFEKEGIIGKAKSFVSGFGQLVIGTGKTIIGELPGVKRFPGEKKGLTPSQALFTSFFATTPKVKGKFVKEQLSLVGPAFALAVKRRPFAVAGQLVLTELGFRGVRKAKVAVIERQPTSVRLGTKGEIITTPSPTKKDVTISVIKPTEFVAEIRGTTIAGIGEGRAAVTGTGDVVAGFKFRTRVAKQAPTFTEVAVKGKIIKPSPEITKGAFIAEIETTTARGKVTKQKAITLAETERIVGGEFPVFRTGGLELRKGKLRIVPFDESIFRIGRVTEPKFVRVGLVKKEADITTPFFTGEQFVFLEKGISVRKFEQVARKRKKEIKRILKGPGEITPPPVFQVGGLIPPIAIPKPKPIIKVKPEGIIVEEFLKGIRGAVKAERIAAIPRVRVGVVTGVGTRDISKVGQIQRQVPKIKTALKSAVKPITETVPKVDSKVGQIAALKPTLAVAQRTGQRALTRQLLKTKGAFAPLPKPMPLPIPIGRGAFALPIPKPGKLKPIPQPKPVKERKRKFRGTISLSVLLGGKGQILTPAQLAGRAMISPLQLRALPKRKRKKNGK